MTSSYLPLSPEYAQFRRRLLSGLLAIACLTILAVSWKIFSSIREREDGARLQSQTYAHAIAAHVSESVRLVDRALTEFAHAVKVLPSEKKTDAKIRQLLARHDPGSSEDLSLMFVSVDGDAIAASMHLAPQGMAIKSLDFFRAHVKARADLGLFVGEPFIVRESNRRIFTLSRRIVNAQGKLLGMVVAPMDAARFASMFDLARLDQDISIALLHQGSALPLQPSKIIARAPLFETSFATRLTSLELFRPILGGSARTFQAISPVDGLSRIYTFAPLETGPLNVLVGLPVRALNQALTNELLIAGANVLLIAMVMLLSARVALQSYRRLEVNKKALQKSEIRWKFVLEGVGDGVWDWNVNTNVVHFSVRCKNMLGYAEDEMENTFDGWGAGIHPDDNAATMAALQACLHGKTQVYVSEYRQRCKDGSWKWILSRGTVLDRDFAGQALRLIGTHVDITIRKQAEQAQVHKIVEAAPDPTLLVGHDGTIAFANKAASSTFGYGINEMTGINIDCLVPFERDGHHANWHKVLVSIQTKNLSDLKNSPMAIRHDGTQFPVEISLSALCMDGQAVVIASIRDVTKSKQAAHLLEQSFSQLRRLSDHQENIKEAERKRIAQDIHDELGQNLLALKLDISTLHMRTAGTHPSLNKRVVLVLDNIDATIKSVKSIMNDLRPATLELGLYAAAEWQLQQFQRSSGISCTLRFDSTADCELDDCQSAAVFRILQESLTNIGRHAQATKVDITLGQDARRFSMTVKDNGKGLELADKKKHNSFGLMGIEERIHSLGGELTISSGRGNGTLLSIVITLEEDRVAPDRVARARVVS